MDPVKSFKLSGRSGPIRGCLAGDAKGQPKSHALNESVQTGTPLMHQRCHPGHFFGVCRNSGSTVA